MDADVTLGNHQQQPLPAEGGEGHPDDPNGPDHLPQPRWEYAAPFGRAPAVETMTGVAAPLLAGFSIAVIGVVAQAPDNFRFPGLALLLLVMAAVAMVLCVQVGFRARSLIYSAADVEAWWPQSDRQKDGSTERFLRQIQVDDYTKWVTQHKWARRLYNTAIVVLALGMGAVLMPPDTYGNAPYAESLTGVEQATRWIATGVAVAAAVGESFWWFLDNWRAKRQLTGN